MDREKVKKDAMILKRLAEHIARGDIEPTEEIAELIATINDKIYREYKRQDEKER